MAQYGTVCNTCPRHLTWRICYVAHDTTMTLVSPMTQTWNQWHHHGNNDTTLSWKWHNMAQYVIYVLPTSPWRTCYVTHDTTMTLMSHMTQTLNQWHTVLELGKGNFNIKQWHNMAQYVIYVLPTSPWRICYVTHDTTMSPMSPMTQTWNQWHTVLELGKGDFGVKQWHNMAQYVIYVLATSPWRFCYVTHDTTMALMSPMAQTWNQWHHHSNNDTMLFWRWERKILL